jgi:hypothetical protein
VAETPLPMIMVEPLATWCPSHLENFRGRWPEGYLPATLCLVHQALNHDDEIIAASGGRAEALSGVLREFGPLCCRLDAAMLDEIIRGSLAGGDAMVATVRKYGPPPSREVAA